MGEGVPDMETQRLRLRRVREADLPALVAISTDPRTNLHRPGGAPIPEQSEDLLRQFMADWDRDGFGYWTVEHQGRVVGIAGVRPASVRGEPCFNLYYRFAPECWGQGLAAEAARATITVAGHREPQRPVVARTRPANRAAIRLAERVGMTRCPELDWRGMIAFVAPVRAGD